MSKNDSINCWRTCINVSINEQNDDDDFVKIVIKAAAVMFDLFPKWDYQWRRKLFFFKIKEWQIYVNFRNQGFVFNLLNYWTMYFEFKIGIILGNMTSLVFSY